ncbi:MAG: hypothetical protein ACI4M6_07120 [Christensenellaceae bacterium]
MFLKKIKSSFFKTIVTLKRKPQNIAMFFLVITFLIFAMNLHNFSNATFKISGANTFTGISQFAIFLLSMLSFVTLLNSYPNRMPTKKPMLALTFALMIVVLLCDFVYLRAVLNALRYHNSGVSPLEAYYDYVVKSKVVLIIHIVFQIITIVLLALRDVLGKLFRKIRTNVAVEENQNMHEIKLSND